MKFTYTTQTISVPKTVTKVTIDPSVTYIKISAFEECTSLTYITIPPSVTHIGDSAFVKCTSLTIVNLPSSSSSSSLTYIGDQAFEGCTSLIYINIPSSVNFIGDHTFHGCDSLLSVVTNYRDVFGLVKCRFENYSLHDLCSSSSSSMDDGDYVVSLESRIREFISQSSSSSSGGGDYNNNKNNNNNNNEGTEQALKTTDPWGFTPLHVLCCNPNANTTMIQTLVQYYPNATISKTTHTNADDDGKTPLDLYKLCRPKHESTYNLSSLHVALKLGMSWVDIKKLIEEDCTVDSLEQGMVDDDDDADDKSGGGGTMFYPFMLAALHPLCDLESVYRLAMYNVENLKPL